MSQKDQFKDSAKTQIEGSGCFQILWRTCNICMCFFFVLAAYVQINDPDAGIWMAAYSIPACLCFMISAKPQITETLLWRRLSDLHTLLCSAVAGILGWSLYKSSTKDVLQKEEGREFSGLLLITVWLLLCRHSGRNPIGGLRLYTAISITVFPFMTWLYYYINKELRTSWPSHCKTAL